MKSRMEIKNKDIYDMEVIKAGGTAGAIAAAILATIFFSIQIFVGGGTNYGLYAIVFIIPAAGFTVKAVKLKRRHEILFAILCWITVAAFSAAHIYQLIAASAIL